MSATARRTSPTVNGLIAAACIVVVVLGLKLASGIVGPILFAVTLAILFAPLLHYLERRGLPTMVALTVMIVGMVLFFGGVLLIVYLSLLKLQERLPIYQDLLAERLAPIIDWLSKYGITSEALPSSVTDGTALVNAALAAIGGILSSAVGIVFFVFLLCLMLVESSNFARKFRAGFRPENPLQERLIAYTREIQQQYKIQCFSNLISATALTTEFLLFRIDFALLWGFLAFILGFIPNIGLIIACIPAIILAFILHGASTAIVVLILGIILNAAMDNLVTPRFLISGVQLPMVFSFLSFLFWTWVFGFFGALLAIPATLFVRALLSSGQQTHMLANFLSAADPPGAPAEVAVPATVPGDHA